MLHSTHKKWRWNHQIKWLVLFQAVLLAGYKCVVYTKTSILTTNSVLWKVNSLRVSFRAGSTVLYFSCIEHFLTKLHGCKLKFISIVVDLGYDHRL